MAALSAHLPRPALFTGVRGRERLLDVLAVLVCIGVGALSAAYIADAPWGPVRMAGEAITGALVIGAAVAVASRRFVLVLMAAILLLTLVPNYGLPGFPPRLVAPGLVVIWVLVVVSLVNRAPTGMTPIDWCVTAIFGGMVLSAIIGAETTKTLFTSSWMWVGPYLAGRFAGRMGWSRTALLLIVLAGVVALPFALLELTSGNVFIKAFPNASGLGVGVVEYRFGHVRSQGAFGQPIPYAMFLSTVALAAVGVWLSRPRGRSSAWLLLVAGACVAVMTTALARTGWIVLGVAAMVVVVFAFRALDAPRHRVVLIAGVVIALVGLSLGPTRNLLFGGGEAATLQSSNDYRKGLLDAALTPGTIKPAGEAPPPVGAQSPSIDNGYLLMALRWGFLPLFGMLLLLPAALAQAWESRGDLLSTTLYAIVVANLVALFGVALMTQSQIFIFLLLGLAAGHGVYYRHTATMRAHRVVGGPRRRFGQEGPVAA
jgi:hypothetical protein